MEDTLFKEIENIKFKQELLFENSEFTRILFEVDCTRTQRDELINLLDSLDKKDMNNEKIAHGSYEQAIYEIFPQHKYNYHFAENLVIALYKEGNYREMIKGLYGHQRKFEETFE